MEKRLDECLNYVLFPTDAVVPEVEGVSNLIGMMSTCIDSTGARCMPWYAESSLRVSCVANQLMPAHIWAAVSDQLKSRPGVVVVGQECTSTGSRVHKALQNDDFLPYSQPAAEALHVRRKHQWHYPPSQGSFRLFSDTLDPCTHLKVLPGGVGACETSATPSTQEAF